MNQAGETALRDLRWHWGEVYAIAITAGHWSATRRDNGRTLTAASADGLHDLIVADYAGQPVTPGHLAEQA